LQLGFLPSFLSIYTILSHFVFSQGLRFAGDPGATIVIPDIGVSGHGVNWAGLGYNILACEPDVYKYRKQIELLEAEVPKVLSRLASPLMLPSSLMLPHSDNAKNPAEKHLFWPAPPLFTPFEKGLKHNKEARKFSKHVSCLKVRIVHYTLMNFGNIVPHLILMWDFCVSFSLLLKYFSTGRKQILPVENL
jgi:hypothetical protein